jgi:hypothetical protein
MLIVPRQTLIGLELVALFTKGFLTARRRRVRLCTSTCQWAEDLQGLEVPRELAVPAEATAQRNVLRAQVGQKATAIVFHGLCQDQGLLLSAQKL